MKKVIELFSHDSNDIFPVHFYPAIFLFDHYLTVIFDITIFCSFVNLFDKKKNIIKHFE